MFCRTILLPKTGCSKSSSKKKLPAFSLDVSWSVGDEMAVLFGYLGSGKSMTLRMIAGLIKPTPAVWLLTEMSSMTAHAACPCAHKVDKLGLLDKRGEGYIYSDSRH